MLVMKNSLAFEGTPTKQHVKSHTLICLPISLLYHHQEANAQFPSLQTKLTSFVHHFIHKALTQLFLNIKHSPSNLALTILLRTNQRSGRRRPAAVPTFLALFPFVLVFLW